jgi:hypothetical protein
MPIVRAQEGARNGRSGHSWSIASCVRTQCRETEGCQTGHDVARLRNGGSTFALIKVYDVLVSWMASVVVRVGSDLLGVGVIM